MEIDPEGPMLNWSHFGGPKGTFLKHLRAIHRPITLQRVEKRFPHSLRHLARRSIVTLAFPLSDAALTIGSALGVIEWTPEEIAKDFYAGNVIIYNGGVAGGRDRSGLG